VPSSLAASLAELSLAAAGDEDDDVSDEEVRLAIVDFTVSLDDSDLVLTLCECRCLTDIAAASRSLSDSDAYFLDRDVAEEVAELDVTLES